jgi:Alginate lyase
MKPTLMLLLIAALCGVSACAQHPMAPVSPVATVASSAPQLLTLEAAALARTRSGDAALQPAFSALKRRADLALQTPPRSVTHKTTTPPSGSKNDYMSMGPYWWPNPATPNGLPYVQRDGQRNPQAMGNALDSMRLQATLADTRDLALAYHFTDDARYAQKAAAVLRTWFLEPTTRMNPHLRFGQAIPGIVEGRGIGIIDTRDLWLAIDAVALIASSGSGLSSDEQQALRQWFADYAQWLHTSPLGRDEAAELNNHGLFYDVQLAAYWLFAGETEKARQLVFDAQMKRLATQIDSQGRMPLELARTRPFHYQTFTLEAATRLARYGQVLDERSGPAKPWVADDSRCRAPAMHINCPLDLWQWEIDGKSLRAALHFVASVVTNPATWQHATALEPRPVLAPVLPVLLLAQRAYPPRSFEAPIAALKTLAPDHVAWLMSPTP